VAKWFKHYQQINVDKNYYSPWLFKLSSGNTISDLDICKYWNQIKSAVSELERIGYQFPFSISNDFDRSQDTLNRLHRFFTYNVLWYHKLWPEYNTENPFDKNFKLPDGMPFRDWLNIIDQINQSVHSLEDFTDVHENKKFILDQYPFSMIAFNPVRKSNTDLDHWLEFTEEDQTHNFNDYWNVESPLVTLDRSILGKCVLQSFYENDDPNAHDCTGRMGSYGGFEIEIDNTRKKIYRSDQFTQWAALHGRDIQSMPLEFPIGYVPDHKHQINILLQGIRTFKKVQFID
jgi:hypothetical protein